MVISGVLGCLHDVPDSFAAGIRSCVDPRREAVMMNRTANSRVGGAVLALAVVLALVWATPSVARADDPPSAVYHVTSEEATFTTEDGDEIDWHHCLDRRGHRLRRRPARRRDRSVRHLRHGGRRRTGLHQARLHVQITSASVSPSRSGGRALSPRRSCSRDGTATSASPTSRRRTLTTRGSATHPAATSGPSTCPPRSPPRKDPMRPS